MTDADQFDVLAFWSLALQLKQLRRQGWLDRGVREAESAADHSWGVALLGWLLARDRPELNRERVLLLGLLHDLPEAVAGDATPFDERRDEDGTLDSERFREFPVYSDSARVAKRAAEVSALEQMLVSLTAGAADEIRGLWREYEEGETSEARFVRQIDKLETLLQAEHYAAAQPELILESFRLGTRRDVSDPALVRLVEAALERSHEQDD